VRFLPLDRNTNSAKPISVEDPGSVEEKVDPSPPEFPRDPDLPWSFTAPAAEFTSAIPGDSCDHWNRPGPHSYGMGFVSGV